MKNTRIKIALWLVATGYIFAMTWVSFADYKWTTSTWLDKIIDIIQVDEWLLNKIDAKKNPVTRADVDTASRSADEMNKIIISSIKATGIANDWEINTADARELNDYIFKNHYSAWQTNHWDDSWDGTETWYHLVQNDWANTIMFWENAINTVFDWIYHLWMETSKKNRLLNEDWNWNAKFSSVWYWLNDMLKDDIKNWTLKNWKIVEVKGTTNTWLDQIVEYLKKDIWLNQNVKTSDFIAWAKSADEMNKIIIEAMKKTWVTNDWVISEADVRELNLYISKNRLSDWVLYHWDDEDGEETWFHLVQNDGASKRMFDKNAVNTVFDGIYHLWFPTNNKFRLQNEDGNNNALFKDVAMWLDGLMHEDIKNNKEIQNPTFSWIDIVSGDWYMIDNWHKWANFNWIALWLIQNKELQKTQSVDINFSNDWSYQNGFIVFDYVSPTEFKYIWARAWSKRWVVWQYKDYKFRDLKWFKDTFETWKQYNVSLNNTQTKVELIVDWVKKLEYDFKTQFTSKKIWFMTEKTWVTFTNFK